jgi:hypothetical protein
MDRDTTIPSILSPMGDADPDRSRPEGDGTLLKLVFWGAIGLCLVLAFRILVR